MDDEGVFVCIVGGGVANYSATLTINSQLGGVGVGGSGGWGEWGLGGVGVGGWGRMYMYGGHAECLAKLLVT